MPFKKGTRMFRIHKSKTFPRKFEVRKPSGRLFATDLTMMQAKLVKRLGNKFERCVKTTKKKGRARSPQAVCRAAILGKGLKKVKKR